MALPSPDMESCCKKQRCLSGANAGQVYDSCEPCPAGQVFDTATCDCIRADSGCWYLQYTAVGPDVPPSLSEFELYQNVPAPGDFFGLNDISDVIRSVGVVSDQADSFPGTGFNHTPNVKECDGTNCDFSDHYWGQIGQVEVCVEARRSDSSNGPFTLGIVTGYSGDGEGYIPMAEHTVADIPGVQGDGTDKCSTTTLTYSKDERFPDWGTCTNPYRLWFKFTVVSGRVLVGDDWVTCDESYCSDPRISWVSSANAFITFEGLNVTNFYTPENCGFWTRNGAIIEYTRTSWWDPVGNSSTHNSPYRGGNVIEGEESSSQAYGTSYSTNTQAKKVEIYLGPANPWDPLNNGRVSEGATLEPGPEFELLMTVDNDSEYIAC